MRKSPLAIAIGMSFHPGVQLAASRVGPVSPYQTAFNREIYYRMLGQQVWRGRSVGKTRQADKNILWPWHYQPKGN